ncbi:MAG: periplasmic protein TonB [Sphingomonadales bacterium]|jgi:protein TonB|nr:periplasmic protein TonB [Sphingomonadales bacterium]MEA3036302.1 periplasmic protein TonB [Sphingomonadales bacterium]
MIGLAIAGMLAAAVEGPIPRSNLKALIGPADYPASLAGRPRPGPVSVLLTVGPNGRVTRCDILRASGAAALDAATCRLLVSRSRFTPASDADGRPTQGGMSATILWPAPAGSKD